MTSKKKSVKRISGQGKAKIINEKYFAYRWLPDSRAPDMPTGILKVSDFSKETKGQEYSHILTYSDGHYMECQCWLTIAGNKATLDYTRDKDKGQFAKEFGTGIFNLVFTDRKRAKLKEMKWLSKGNTSPDLIGVEIIPCQKAFDYEDFEEQLIINSNKLKHTEKIALIASRRGQGKFRSDLIDYWQGCAVTENQLCPILKASHIKPWRKSNNKERLDVFNGLLLTPNFDVLFDKGLITFSDNGDLIISNRHNTKLIEPLIGSKLLKIKTEQQHKKYLSYHRENIFIKD